MKFPRRKDAKAKTGAGRLQPTQSPVTLDFSFHTAALPTSNETFRKQIQLSRLAVSLPEPRQAVKACLRGERARLPPPGIARLQPGRFLFWPETGVLPVQGENVA